MRSHLRSLVSLLLIAFGCAFFSDIARAQERTFSHPLLASEAKRYEEELKKAAQTGQATRDTAQSLAKAAAKARSDGDARKAVSILTRAVALNSADPDLWRSLSQALAEVETEQSSEQSELNRKASAAAYIAMERSTTKPQRAQALAVLGEALKKRSMWRPALDAYRASLAANEVAAVRESFNELLAEHGFKVADYKVEANLGEPRLCLQMSERIASGRNDIASFVRVDGRDPQGVQVEGSQLCIEGQALRGAGACRPAFRGG
jgi:tetratricopeptide (TPR) repeat protein